MSDAKTKMSRLLQTALFVLAWALLSMFLIRPEKIVDWTIDRMTTQAGCQCKETGENSTIHSTMTATLTTSRIMNGALLVKQTATNSSQNHDSSLSSNSIVPSFLNQFNNCNFPTPILSSARSPSVTSLLTTTSTSTTRQTTTPLLRDIHMVLIGDSLMRYQYLSLVYRLRHAVWFDASMWYYNLVSELSFGDPFHRNTWGSFMFHTNQLLQPYEICDCYREMGHLKETVENRYYYDPILNNSIVFLLSYGHFLPMVGRLQPHQVRQIVPNNNGWSQRRALQKRGKLSWEYTDWSDVIRNHVQHLDPPPRHIVMNAGAWPHSFGYEGGSHPNNETTSISSNDRPNVSQATRHLVRVMQDLPQYQYVWRTTTYKSDGTRHDHGSTSDSIMCEIGSMLCVNVSFTGHVRRTLYWDKMHYEEPVYRAQNEHLLNVLGYLPSDYKRMNLSEILENEG